MRSGRSGNAGSRYPMVGQPFQRISKVNSPCFGKKRRRRKCRHSYEWIVYDFLMEIQSSTFIIWKNFTRAFQVNTYFDLKIESQISGWKRSSLFMEDEIPSGSLRIFRIRIFQGSARSNWWENFLMEITSNINSIITVDEWFIRCIAPLVLISVFDLYQRVA